MIRFGKNRPNRWCRSHESLYMTEDIDEMTSTTSYLAQAIVEVNNGCWSYVGADAQSNITTNHPQVWCNGLRWYVSRYMFIRFFGAHRGGLELHHRCGNGWCVRPDHLVPIGHVQNMKIERKKWSVTWRRVVDKWLVSHNPRTPDDPVKANELSLFAAGVPVANQRRGHGYTMAQMLSQGRTRIRLRQP